MKKQLLTLILFSLVTFTASATSPYYPQDFLNSSPSLKDGALKDAIFNVLNNFHAPQNGSFDIVASSCPAGANCYRQVLLSYTTARRFLFGDIDLEKDSQGNAIHDVYCDRDMHDRTIGPNQIPNVNVVNCEHTWPQSKFSNSFPRDLQKGDLNHLYSTDAKVNSTRGNNPFGEVVDGEAPEAGCNASRVGGVAENPSGTYFEPAQNHKGNVARALFYFSVRYKLPIDKIQEAALRKWHHEDPVTKEDMERNEKVYSIQKNRNPFIDFPQLVDQISDF